jgi:hypothetical protein
MKIYLEKKNANFCFVIFVHVNDSIEAMRNISFSYQFDSDN